MIRDRLATIVPQTLTFQLPSQLVSIKIQYSCLGYLSATHFVLRLPGHLHMEIHKVLNLPRNMYMENQKVLHLPRQHMEVHKVLHLTKSAHGKSQSAAPATKSAMEVHKSVVSATKSAHTD